MSNALFFPFARAPARSYIPVVVKKKCAPFSGAYAQKLAAWNDERPRDLKSWRQAGGIARSRAAAEVREYDRLFLARCLDPNA